MPIRKYFYSLGEPSYMDHSKGSFLGRFSLLEAGLSHDGCLQAQEQGNHLFCTRSWDPKNQKAPRMPSQTKAEGFGAL